MDDQAPDITAFLTDLAREARSERTWVAYQSDLNLFARWLTQSTGDPFSAKTLTRIDVRDYKHHLLSVEGRTPATVNRRLAALRAFGAWAKRKGFITELPTDGTSDVPVPKQAPKALEPRAIDRVLRRSEQSGNLRDRAILLTLYHTGIRVSELCDLRVSDVDISDRKGTRTVRAGKGMKQRTIPLTNDARKAVAQYLAERPSRDPGDFPFTSRRTGSRLTSKGVRELAAKYGYQAQVEDAHPHAFRHSFGTELLRKGAPLPTIGALLGHESLQSTARYTQLSERDLRAAVGQIGADGRALTTPNIASRKPPNSGSGHMLTTSKAVNRERNHRRACAGDDAGNHRAGVSNGARSGVHRASRPVASTPEHRGNGPAGARRPSAHLRRSHTRRSRCR